MTITLERTDVDHVTFALRPATMADLEAAVALFNKSSLDQVGRHFTNVQEVGEEWAMEKFDLDKSTRVAELPDGRLVGYIEVWDTQPLPVNNWVWGRVDPDYEGLGIGTELMDWAERRLESTVSRVPADLRVAYRAGAYCSHEPSKALFVDRGMTFVRRFWNMMVTFDGPPPDAIWPDGVRITSMAERDDLRAVFRAMDEAFRDHWGYVEQPEEEAFADWKQWIESQSDLDPSIWYLAVDGDEIAGVCLCSRNRAEYPGAAWVNTLGVRRPWRKQGVALALLHHCFGVFYREGKKGVGLGVDSASLTGATRLYEKAGMSVVSEFDTYEMVLREGRDIAKK